MSENSNLWDKSFGQMFDKELEQLRNQVLNCAEEGQDSSTSNNKDEEGNDGIDYDLIQQYQYRVCGISNNFELVLKVSETFGVDLTSAKELKNKELQEDLRSLSRIQESGGEDSSDMMIIDDETSQDLQNINSIKPQISQLQSKNVYELGDQQNMQDQMMIKSQYNSNMEDNNSRNNNQKLKQQHQTFLEKASQEQQKSQKSFQQQKVKNLEQEKSQQQLNNEKIFKRAFIQIVQGIKVWVWPCFRIPAANNAIALMNCSFFLADNKSYQEKKDIDFLIAVSLMNGRKFIQACEIFRKLQGEILSQALGGGNALALEKAIQLEILIADSMNQHSQMSEKMQALQRAVDLSLKRKVKQININTNTHTIHQIKEEETYKMLMKMHPQLIKILLQNIDSKIEAIKLSVLRTLEFVLDTIGCSLDLYLIHILISIIATYPRSSILHQEKQQDHQRQSFFTQSTSQNINIQQLLQASSSSSAQSSLTYHHQLYNSQISDQKQDSFSFFSIDNYIIDYNDKHLVIKDGQTFQQQYQQSIKNLQNHILETFISLLSSMTSNVLQAIFNEVIQKNVFIGNNPFENQLATDLRIYLLKFTDKIIIICQGDIVLSQRFLNNFVTAMIPDQRIINNLQKQLITGNNNTQKLGETHKLKLKAANETVSLACQNLWQTFRTKLFNNYSNKGFKSLLEWIIQSLAALSENIEFLTLDDQSKLTLLLDVIELIAQAQQSNPQQQSNATSLGGRKNKGSIPQNSIIGLNMQNQNSSFIPNLYILELYSLIKPLLFWLDYSIEKQERINLFKQVWRTLTSVMRSLPTKKLDIDLSSIILPVLLKVNSFCQSSSPSQEMLQFLIVVLNDFKEQKLSKELIKFLDCFLKTISKCIPHHLHDEIFQVCEILLELLTSNSSLIQAAATLNSQKVNSISQNDNTLQNLLTAEHVQLIIEALIDRYTMRSKAHKRLTQQFIQLVLNKSKQDLQKQLLDQQHQQLQQERAISSITQQQEQQQLQQQQQQQQQQHNRIEQQQQQIVDQNFPQLVADFNDDLDNYEYDRESYQYLGEEDEYEDHQQHSNHIIQEGGGLVSFPQSSLMNEQLNNMNRISGITRGENQSNQDYSESPVSQRLMQRNQLGVTNFDPLIRLQQYQQNPNEIRQQDFNIQDGNINTQANTNNFITIFDIFFDYCLFKNSNENSQIQENKIRSNKNNQTMKSPFQTNSESIKLELYFEKLDLILLMIKSMNQEHIPLFQRLINKEQLKISCYKIFQNEKSSIQAFELLEALASYYMTNCAPKNIYEHPISLLQNNILQNEGGQFSPLHNNNHHNNNNNQNSQSSSSHQQQQQQHQFPHNNRESSRNSFISNNNNQLFQRHQRLINQIQLVPPTQLMPNQLNNRQQDIEDELMMGIGSNQDDIVKDEIDIINKERLVLIQIFSTIIRMSIDQLAKQGDSYLQFNTLNLIDNLFSNLMPVPTFNNILIKKALGKDARVNNINEGGGNAGTMLGVREDQFSSQQQNLIAQLEIPDFERMIIIDNPQTYLHLISQPYQQQQHQTTQTSPNSMIHLNSFILSEFECTEIKYLHARLQFALKIWSFLESSFFSSSWSNIRNISQGVMCQAMKIEIQNYKSSYQSKVKKILFPLLSNLLNSTDSESKAGGLNILGTFCGLGYDFQSLQSFKVIDNLAHFQRNANFVSFAIWQQVFNSQDDWDQTIREAASVLVQVCAPRDLIKQFYRIMKEQYQLKLSSLITTFNVSSSQHMRSKQYQYSVQNVDVNDFSGKSDGRRFDGEKDEEDENENDEENQKTNRLSFFNQTQSMGIGGGMVGTAFNPTISQNEFHTISDNEEEKNNSSFTNKSNDSLNDNNQDYFFVNHLNEDQLRELISIFKYDYKPQKNLWIEKGNLSNNMDSNSNKFDNQNNDSSAPVGIQNQNNDLYFSSNALDVFEDNIVNKLNLKLSNQDSIGKVLDNFFSKGSELSSEIKVGGGILANGSISSSQKDDTQTEIENLIFERHFESDKELKLLNGSGGVSSNNSGNSQQEGLKKGASRKDGGLTDIQGSVDGINQEELGIIDLDGEDVLDEFDELDDDKLPVLKNTYSKKTRPNNSKSVAIGSRSQGGNLKSRSSYEGTKELNEIEKQKSKANSRQQQQKEVEESKSIGELLEEKGELKGIEEVEQFMSKTVINKLRDSEEKREHVKEEFNQVDDDKDVDKNQKLINDEGLSILNTNSLQATQQIKKQRFNLTMSKESIQRTINLMQESEKEKEGEDQTQQEQYINNLNQPSIIQPQQQQQEKIQLIKSQQINFNQQNLNQNQDEQDQIIDQYEQLIAATVNSLSQQFKSDQSSPIKYPLLAELPKKDELNSSSSQVNLNQMQITATMRLNKKLEEQFQKSNQKTKKSALNKSTEITLTSGGIAATNVNTFQGNAGGGTTTSSSSKQRSQKQTLSPPSQNTSLPLYLGYQSNHIQQMRKINDPTYQKVQSYSSQATSKFKQQQQQNQILQSKKEQLITGQGVIVQKAPFVYNNVNSHNNNNSQQKGEQNSKLNLTLQSYKGNNSNNNTAALSSTIAQNQSIMNQYQLNQTNISQQNSRKKKNDFQRKSEVPHNNQHSSTNNSNLKRSNNNTSMASATNNQQQQQYLKQAIIKQSQIQLQQQQLQQQQQKEEQREKRSNQLSPSHQLSSSIEKYQYSQSNQVNIKKQQQDQQQQQQQTTLMNQAKQVFVSRAKSQSYLNNVMAIGSNSSLGSQNKKKQSFKQSKLFKNSNSIATSNITQQNISNNSALLTENSDKQGVAVGPQMAHQRLQQNQQEDLFNEQYSQYVMGGSGQNQRGGSFGISGGKIKIGGGQGVMMKEINSFKVNSNNNNNNSISNPLDCINISDIKVEDVQDKEYLKSKQKLDQYKLNNQQRQNRNEQSNNQPKHKFNNLLQNTNIESREQQQLQYQQLLKKEGGFKAIEVSCSQGDDEVENDEQQFLGLVSGGGYQSSEFQDTPNKAFLEELDQQIPSSILEEDSYGNEGDEVKKLFYSEENPYKYGKLKPLSSIDEEDDLIVGDQKQVNKRTNLIQQSIQNVNEDEY